MNTVISNKTGEALELAKRVLYSVKVLSIGLFIPFLFLFGITYPKHATVPENGINISNPNHVITENTTVDLGKILTDSNS
jgi:hypothetical protein